MHLLKTVAKNIAITIEGGDQRKKSINSRRLNILMGDSSDKKDQVKKPQRRSSDVGIKISTGQLALGSSIKPAKDDLDLSFPQFDKID